MNLINIIKIFKATTNDDTSVVDDTTATFHPNGYQVATVIFVIITFLVIITILFELLKDYMIESSDRYTKPITLTLFSELTILGFLSLCAFAVAYTGYFEVWSVDFFGSTAISYLEHRVDDVQYFIFLILLLIIIQVYILVGIGNSYTVKFREFNAISQSDEKMRPLLRKVDEIQHTTYISWMYDYVTDPFGAWRKHNDRLETEETVLFYALRKEHILRRSPLPPFEPERKDRQLPATFDYAHYLSLCLSRFLTDVVTLSPISWVAALGFLFCFYAILMLANGEYFAVALTWLAIGYIDMFALMFLEASTHHVFEHLINPSHLKILDDELNPNPEGVESYNLSTYDTEVQEIDGVHPDVHSSLIKRMKSKAHDLPLFTGVTPEPPGTLSTLLTDKVPPNRHESLFFGDKMGPDLNIFAVRFHIFLQSLYFAFMVIFFIPMFFEDYGWKIGVGYMVAALLPFPIQFLGFYGRLVVEMSHSQNTGCLKHGDTEKDVIRDQKLEKVIRLMVTLAHVQAKHKHHHGAKKERGVAEELATDMTEELKHVGDIFDKFDKAGTGEIPVDQMRPVLQSLGISFTETTLKKLVAELDASGDGTVSREELLEWRISNGEKGESDPEEDAKAVFKMLIEIGKEGDGAEEEGEEKEGEKVKEKEKEKKGKEGGKEGEEEEEEELTTYILQCALLRFTKAPYKIPLTAEEIGSIVRDFDEEGTGVIEFEAFYKMISEGQEHE